MYARKDKAPRMITPGFEHLNNFVLFDDGADVFIKRIDNDESLTTNLVQYTERPLGAHCNHYSMEIQDITEGEFVMFGLTNKCMEGYPMWTIDRSLRYHSNDGGVFNGGMGVKTYHPYGVGDRVTCHLDYIGTDRCLVNFLRNDQLVYRQWVNLPPDQLYPTIGVSRTEAKLKVVWPTTKADKEITIRKDLLTNWFGWSGLERDNDKMEVSLVKPDDEMEREAYSLQSPVVLSPDFSYFEVEILAKGDEEGCHGIGLVAGNCEAFVMPGWTIPSIGYHSDDGGLYSDGQDKKGGEDPAKSCAVGDRMGCGIVFPKISPGNYREPVLVLVYFTKNGQLVHKKRMRQPRGGFFPCVGFFRKGDSIRIDVACKPPEDTKDDLSNALNLADETSDFRCSEVIQFKELAPDSAMFTLATEEDNPQLVQYLRYPLAHTGDGFFLKVVDLRPNTELQIGISASDHAMEGDFLGSNSTSCGYLLKLGSIATKDCMRPAGKWSGPADEITCYLDLHDERLAILCFQNGREEMLGRAVVARKGGGENSTESPLLCSVVLSSGPATVRLNWSRTIYNAHNLDRAWGSADKWLRPPGIKADKNKLTLKTSESYAFAACAQSRHPMLTGSSFFSIKLLGGERLAGIGLGSATSDINNVLGSEKGEVCFLPSQGELIIQNNRWRVEAAPQFKAGDVLQCGMVFAESDRVEQKGVVYFCHNDQEFFHCRFTMAHGGAYPTITFATQGCSAELLHNSRAQPIPEKLAAEWLNTDKMEGVVPCKGSELVGPGTYDDEDKEEELQIVDSGYSEQVIFVSHTIRERDRVDPIIASLRKTYPNFTFETSVSCVGNTAKGEAIKRSEAILVFMSKLYCESHEMVMEFSFLGNDKPILIAADKGMDWPPGDYFSKEHDILERLPIVAVSTVGDEEAMANLTHAVSELFMKEGKGGKNSKGKSKARKHPGNAANGVKGQHNGKDSSVANSNGGAQPEPKSKTCVLL